MIKDLEFHEYKLQDCINEYLQIEKIDSNNIMHDVLNEDIYYSNNYASLENYIAPFICLNIFYLFHCHITVMTFWRSVYRNILISLIDITILIHTFIIYSGIYNFLSHDGCFSYLSLLLTSI